MNVDESWISESDYSRRMWCPTDGAATISNKPLRRKVALIAAVDTEGRAYFALTHSLTNSEVIGTFFSHLCKALDLERADWRQNTVILLDGAKYHLSLETREYLRKLQVPTIVSIFIFHIILSTVPIFRIFP